MTKHATGPPRYLQHEMQSLRRSWIVVILNVRPQKFLKLLRVIARSALRIWIFTSFWTVTAPTKTAMIQN